MPRITSLIRSKKWDKVSELLCQSNQFHDKTKGYKCCYQCSERHNILHYVLTFNPPISVVRDIIETFPEAAHETDCMLRYPLHTALMYGSSADVVSHLMKVNEKAVTAVDKEGKTSLHLLFIDYRIKSKCYKLHREEAKMYFPEIIHMLCHHEPEMVLKEDWNDMNVLEYVIQEEVDCFILRLLQTVGESVMKRDDLSWFRKPRSYVKKVDEKSASQSQFGKIMHSVRKTLASRTA